MRQFVFTFVTLALLAAPASAGAEPPSVRVRQDAAVGKPEGTLVFGEQAIEFRPSGAGSPRRWPYDRLATIVVDGRKGPVTLRLRTKGSRRWLWFRRGETSFITAGEALPVPIVDVLMRQAPVPVVSSVVPAASWELRLPATHERRRRPPNGELRVAQDGSLAFVGGTADTTRFWRRRDVAAVLPLADDRLQIDVNEARGGRPTPYVFRLRAPLSADAYNRLWGQITRFNRGGPS